jgi:hypothetical protein
VLGLESKKFDNIVKRLRIFFIEKQVNDSNFREMCFISKNKRKIYANLWQNISTVTIIKLKVLVLKEKLEKNGIIF